MMNLQTTTLTDTLQFPESPRWHDLRLWCCDFGTQRVLQIDLTGDVQTVLQLSSMVTGIAWSTDGRLLIASASERRLLRVEGEELVQVADLSHLVEYPLNDIVVDEQGRVYIGSLGYDFGNYEATPQPGHLLLVTTEGHARIVADGLAFPNGMAITLDGRTLIVAESHASRLAAFDIAIDGSLSNRRVWAQFDQDEAIPFERRFSPDGICLDMEGAVWVASPSTREVVRVREGGQIADRISLKNIPLACVLGGEERRTLFIPTTGSFDPSDTTSKGRMEMAQVEIAGTGMP